MKRYRKLFWIFLIIYFIYFLSFIPGYILTHTLDYLEEEQYRFWESLDKVFQKNKILRLCEKISVNSKTVIKVIYWSD